MQQAFPPARSSRGAYIEPRRFEFEDLAFVPQYWFGNNPLLTHFENAFSIFIPPGERFFIRAVRHYADAAKDPELADLVRAFVQQEGLHMRAHHELNASFEQFGVDVDREVAHAEETFAWIEKRVPAKLQLGMTAFLEHLTATGAHALFLNPDVGRMMHPEMERFWRWHAVEELEHKAVAFDLLRDVGGGYLVRVGSAFLAMALLARPFARTVGRLVAKDPRRPTKEERHAAREVDRRLLPLNLRLLAAYFKPGFHPNDFDDRRFLSEWYSAAAA